jgi:hypothetical protein
MLKGAAGVVGGDGLIIVDAVLKQAEGIIESAISQFGIEESAGQYPGVIVSDHQDTSIFCNSDFVKRERGSNSGNQ